MFLLWLGWFGFNGGSTLLFSNNVPPILLNTLLASCAGGMAALALSWCSGNRGPNVVRTMCGVLAGLVSIISKEVIYRWTVFVGKKIRSSAVVANAWHHRSDAFSSIPAVIAVGIARIFPSWSFVDHVGAIVVSLFILQAAWKIVWPSLKELADTGASPEFTHDIEKIILSTEGVLSVHKIRTRKIGHGYQVDLHIQVDGGWPNTKCSKLA